MLARPPWLHPIMHRGKSITDPRAITSYVKWARISQASNKHSKQFCSLVGLRKSRQKTRPIQGMLQCVVYATTGSSEPAVLVIGTSSVGPQRLGTAVNNYRYGVPACQQMEMRDEVFAYMLLLLKGVAELWDPGVVNEETTIFGTSRPSIIGRCTRQIIFTTDASPARTLPEAMTKRLFTTTTKLAHGSGRQAGLE